VLAYDATHVLLVGVADSAGALSVHRRRRTRPWFTAAEEARAVATRDAWNEYLGARSAMTPQQRYAREDALDPDGCRPHVVQFWGPPAAAYCMFRDVWFGVTTRTERDPMTGASFRRYDYEAARRSIFSASDVAAVAELPMRLTALPAVCVAIVATYLAGTVHSAAPGAPFPLPVGESRVVRLSPSVALYVHFDIASRDLCVYRCRQRTDGSNEEPTFVRVHLVSFTVGIAVHPTAATSWVAARSVESSAPVSALTLTVSSAA
jgi:hypothetical protein